MAVSTPFIKYLEEELTCSICSGIYTDPITLPCLHSYCKACIKSFEEQCACPKCQTAIDLPKRQDDSNQRFSFYLDALLKLLEAVKNVSAEEKEESECVSCEKCLALDAFCPHCGGLICKECYDSHKTMKQLRNQHQAVTKLSEFKQGNLKEFIDKQMSCMEKSHEKNDLCRYFYCKEDTCKKCICQGCLLLGFRNHDVETVEEAAQQAKESIKEAIDKLEQAKKIYEEELSLSKQNLSRIEGEVELARLEIDKERELYIKLANDHAETMNEALNKLILDQKTVYQEEQSVLSTLMKQIAEYQNRCRRVIERNVTYDILEKRDPVQRGTEALSEHSSKPRKRWRVQYKTGHMMNPSLDCLYDHGSIVESGIDPSHSTIESLKEVREGFWNEFAVVTRNSDGKIWYEQEDEAVELNVTITRASHDGGSDLTTEDFFDEKSGKYRMRFKATEVIPYKISVNIGGEPIKNSPQTVNTTSINAKFNPLKTFGEYGVGKGKLQTPRSIAVGNGKIAIADCTAHRIQVFSLDGKTLREFGSKALECGDGELTWPFGVVFSGDRLLVSDQPGNGRIQEFDSEGTYLRTVFRPPQEEWFLPRGMCIVKDNIVAVCCWGNKCLDISSSVKLLSKEGELIKNFDVMEGLPLHITFGDDRLFVSFVSKNYICAFNMVGDLVFTFRDLEELDGHLNTANGLSFYGNGTILVCDGNNHSVEQYTKKGQFVQSFGTLGSDVGQMLYPIDVAVSADGQVFVLENEGRRVHVWN